MRESASSRPCGKEAGKPRSLAASLLVGNPASGACRCDAEAEPRRKYRGNGASQRLRFNVRTPTGYDK